MPKLTIVIGGNGAGKTTWCRRHRDRLPGQFYNADSIAEGTHAILIGTESAAVNAERVAARVAAGTGHHVPRAEVERRWTASQDNLVRTARAIDVVDLVDNTGPQARLITRIRDGRPTSPATPTPEWAAKLTSRIADAWSAADADAER